MKKFTQPQIAQTLGVSQSFVSQLLTEKKKVSWPLAEKLSDLFPGKTIQQWKRATPEDLKQAFEQLKDNNTTAEKEV